MNKKNRNKNLIIIFSAIGALVIIGLAIFFLSADSTEEQCNPGQEKCEDTIYYLCTENKWVSQGEVAGKCGVEEEENKQTYYRFESNKCDAVSLLPEEVTGNDYETLEECESQIVGDCLIDKGVLGTINNVKFSYQYTDVIRMDKTTDSGSVQTTWAGHYDCDFDGLENAETIKSIGWISDSDYDALLALLKNNPPCTC